MIKHAIYSFLVTVAVTALLLFFHRELFIIGRHGFFYRYFFYQCLSLCCIFLIAAQSY